MSWNSTPKGVIAEYLKEQGVVVPDTVIGKTTRHAKKIAGADGDLEALLAEHLRRLPPAARTAAAQDLMAKTLAYRKRVGRRFSRKG
jgi:hypothetical protein